MLKLYNTLTRKKEKFLPRKGKRVNIFVCGPTVYDFPHLGHARIAVFFDSFVKYLREKGYQVFYLQNITDIDDKIIQRAKKENVSFRKIARKFEREYLKEMKNLKVNAVTKYPRATEHIKEIISQVKRLMEKGFAYEIEDGIYYDISKFKSYGKLARRTFLLAEDAVSRIDEGVKKKNKGDFCLWKRSKEGEPKWKSPFQEGRPGWHIEDTAITEKYFGPQYDIHGGGMDLIFPHHEAEIAQMEAISGKSPMVKYWLHVGILKIRGQKMSKSLGNFILIKDFLKENPQRYRILRYLLLKNHYRSVLDFKDEILSQAKKELMKIDDWIEKIKEVKKKGKPNLKVEDFERKFEKKIEDDFNLPGAFSVLFELMKKSNILLTKNLLTKKDSKNILGFLKKIDKFLNFIFWEKEKIPKKILKLVKERERYRKIKDFEMADKIREKIKGLGWWVEDTPRGPKIKRLLD